jgi:hypothetical protein
MMPNNNNNNNKLALELYFKFHHLQLGHKRSENGHWKFLQQKKQTSSSLFVFWQ